MSRPRWSTATAQGRILWERRDQVRRMAAAYGASAVVVFGSVARGEAGPDSDIDLWVEFDHRRNDPASLDRLAAELERLLGFGVDVGCSLTMGGGAMSSLARDSKSL